MLHIDDWLDDPETGPANVKEWLEHFRRPAIKIDHDWLRTRQLFCTYKDGKRYRCIGCSSMGDVWLTEHFDRENSYDLRIDIADCTEWEVMSKEIQMQPTHIEWMDIDESYCCVTQLSIADAIEEQVKKGLQHGHVYANSTEALEDFMAVHWATFVART